jgi:hypothetical protein
MEWCLAPAAPAGFPLEGRRNARYYTVITYRASMPRWVSTDELLVLARDRRPTLLAERQ